MTDILQRYLPAYNPFLATRYNSVVVTMDFAILPTDRIRDHVEIPCIAVEDYDDGRFADYPTRNGWEDRSMEEWTTLFLAPPPELLAFLQTWLLFAPIATIFQKHVSLSSFTKRSASGNLIIDSSLLVEWLNNAPIFHLSPQNTEAEFASFIITWTQVHFFLQEAGKRVQDTSRQVDLTTFISTGLAPSDPRDPATVLAITLLVELLLEYCLMSGRYLGTGMSVTGSASLSSPYKSYLYNRMMEDGWCPRELSYLFTRFNTSAIYFLQASTRPHPGRVHKVKPREESSTPTEDTEQPKPSLEKLCTRDICAELQLNDETYETEHIEGCDKEKCYSMEGDPEVVLQILEDGNIPLIVSMNSATDDGSRDLTLVPSDPNIPYVAISHVWSDGLGNPTKSALPHCQILRLSNMIQNLPDDFDNIDLFWIDTIGCPPDAAGDDKAQNLAISKMRETYENATAVLVLDGWLLTQKINHLSDHEILMKIISSTWNSRLWTLQEGALAKTLFFQFLDGPYNVDEGASTVRNTTNPILKWTLTSTISERLHEIREYMKKTDAMPAKINNLRAVLSKRSTSVATDEPLCLGTLLGFDESEMMEVIISPLPDRMQVFWSKINEIPSSIIFAEYDRLKFEGYRWAPRSFLGVSSPQLSLDTFTFDKPGMRTSSGLHITCSGFIFNAERNPLPHAFWVIGDDNQIYETKINLDGLETASDHDISAEFTSLQLQDTQLFPNGRATEKTINFHNQYGADVICFMFFHSGFQSDEPTLIIGMFGMLQIVDFNVIHIRRLCSGSATILRQGVHDSRLFNLAHTYIEPTPPERRNVTGDIVIPNWTKLGESGVVRAIRATVIDQREWCIS